MDRCTNFVRYFVESRHADCSGALVNVLNIYCKHSADVSVWACNALARIVRKDPKGPAVEVFRRLEALKPIKKFIKNFADEEVVIRFMTDFKKWAMSSDAVAEFFPLPIESPVGSAHTGVGGSNKKLKASMVSAKKTSSLTPRREVGNGGGGTVGEGNSKKRRRGVVDGTPSQWMMRNDSLNGQTMSGNLDYDFEDEGYDFEDEGDDVVNDREVVAGEGEVEEEEEVYGNDDVEVVMKGEISGNRRQKKNEQYMSTHSPGTFNAGMFVKIRLEMSRRICSAYPKFQDSSLTQGCFLKEGLKEAFGIIISKAGRNNLVQWFSSDVLKDHLYCHPGLELEEVLPNDLPANFKRPATLSARAPMCARELQC